MIYISLKDFTVTPKLIKTLRFLVDIDFVVIGLLKKGFIPYEDRLYILQNLTICDPVDVDIFPQNDEDPTENLIKYKCKAMATHDKWETIEEKAIEKLGLTKVDVKFKVK